MKSSIVICYNINKFTYILACKAGRQTKSLASRASPSSLENPLMRQ